MQLVESMNREILVFGSNLSGIHGAGAALAARHQYGAVLGVGSGLTGNAYAIPTKGYNVEVLPKSGITTEVIKFNMFTWRNPNMSFKVTRIGCGLAGYRDDEIAFLFTGANHSNTKFDEAWKSYLPVFANFWGTYEK